MLGQAAAGDAAAYGRCVAPNAGPATWSLRADEREKGARPRKEKMRNEAKKGPGAIKNAVCVKKTNPNEAAAGLVVTNLPRQRPAALGTPRGRRSP
jgi:hypothetical protein